MRISTRSGLLILCIVALVAGCSGADEPVSAGQISVSDGAGGSDASGTLADGAAAVDGVAALTDGQVSPTGDGGGVTVKDGGAPGKDGGGITTEDGGGTTTKDGGGTTTKDSASGPPDIPGDKDKKYQSCPDLFTCAQVACDFDPKPGCYDICIDNASWAAKTDFTPFADCAWGKCYPEKCAKSANPKECFSECYGTCGGLLYQCLADGATGSTTCSTAWACMEGCEASGKDEFQCNIDCYKNLSQAGQDQFDTLFKCMAAEPGDNPWAACVDKLLTCSSDGVSGSETCLDMVTCTGGCDKGMEDFICSGKCYGKGNAAAQKKYSDVFACYAAAGEGGSGIKCIDKVIDCANPSGKLDCLEVWPCVEECQKGKDDDGVCMYQCLGKSTPKAAKAFLEVALCMDENKEDGTKCVDETVACVNPTGTLICTKIPACLGDCVKSGKSNGVCYYECLKKGSPKETKAFLAWQACADTLCEPVCKDKPEGSEMEACKDACGNEKCKAEKLACLS